MAGTAHYHWRTLLRARAIENQCVVVGCNPGDMDPDKIFDVASEVIGPRGEVLVEGDDGPVLLPPEVDLAALDEAQRRILFLDDRHPECYQLRERENRRCSDERGLPLDGIVSVVYQQLVGDEWSEVDAGIPEEAPLSIYVNGVELATFMCTPARQDALALGFLANEELIAGLDEVAVVHVCGGGTCVDVWLNHAVQRPSRPIITSGCGGGLTFDDLSEQIEPLNSDKRVRPTQLQRLMHQLNSAGKLYRGTRGIHTSALSDGEHLVLVAEDVGRHNTLDKLRGLAMMQNVDTRDLILLSSGRISSEMLNKAARMRVPVIASRTSPTSLSVTLAQAWGITLVGYARQNRMNVYAGQERLHEGPPDKGRAA